MVIEKVTGAINSVSDKIVGAFYGEETMAEAQQPGDDERLKKVAFVRDGVRLIITAMVVIVVAAIAYFVAKKIGLISWIQSKIS